MAHVGLAALLIGVTVATVLYFMFGTSETPQQYYETNRSYSQTQYTLTDDPEDCSICLSPLTQGEKCVLRQCKHKFHKHCIEQVKNCPCGPEALCPLCRRPIV